VVCTYTGFVQETARINTFRALRRPEYYFRPSLLWRRIRRDSLCARNAVQLAWGLPIEVDAKAWIGIDIIKIGTHDRVVPEAIWRLLDSGEQAIDIGANIGQNASIMALKSGPQGHVTAFEPGPEAFRLLSKNVASWQRYQLAPIEILRQEPSALTSRSI